MPDVEDPIQTDLLVLGSPKSYYSEMYRLQGYCLKTKPRKLSKSTLFFSSDFHLTIGCARARACVRPLYVLIHHRGSASSGSHQAPEIIVNLLNSAPPMILGRKPTPLSLDQPTLCISSRSQSATLDLN
ncbi:hypothetical protein NPIL_361 [Nephila pilipes]|uniref:Uncharacterized protein n=1 Tax=Nephila pilipes TaxID=299642 RepID=A0A8X6QV67_NEPPI|nr:hypothetical protein NPIL_361 [Nephila pilipes]